MRKLLILAVLLITTLGLTFPSATAADESTSATSAYCDDVQQLCTDLGYAETMSCLLYNNRDCFNKGMRITFMCMRAHGCSAPNL
jgi:hypothetical protein